MFIFIFNNYYCNNYIFAFKKETFQDTTPSTTPQSNYYTSSKRGKKM